MFLIAFAAVYRPGSIRLEWDLGLFATFGTGNICHFSWTAIVATSTATTVFIFSLKHLIHLPLGSIQGTETTLKTSQQRSLNQRIQHHLKNRSTYILIGKAKKIICLLLHPSFTLPSFSFCYLLLVIMESISLSLSSWSSPTD